jgi:two-component system, cell cycle sensor histidine kinase and response regulator CckA
VVPLNHQIREMVTMLQPMLGPDIEVRLSLEEDPAVRVDTGQMQQVLMNLAVNARDAMRGGGAIEIATRTEWLEAGSVGVFPPAAGRSVRLTFADGGGGIAPDVMPLIFEPFFTTKPEGLGTGLGLSTVYGIVKQSEGEIAVESTVGLGTTFHVLLPAVG